MIVNLKDYLVTFYCSACNAVFKKDLITEEDLGKEFKGGKIGGGVFFFLGFVVE